MGQFYGINLFLAESSATTGGLDSLLEPTGNIKRAQDMAARAFGAEQVFFVTNGTSTSNKMVLQALIAPGDIVILDRNCHKSHHYGLVLSGAQPFYVEAFPMAEFSMYGAVPLRTIKKALLDLKAEGRLDRVKMVDLTNCTFDGHIYNTRRVMEECLAIKPDLIFLWDEAWFGFARWSPFLRPRTAMGAAADIEAWMQDARTRSNSTRNSAPSSAMRLQPRSSCETRLVPDPDAIALRVYQTNSTHKSMSAIRQGSMVLVKDVDFHKVEAQFHEAVFTHASTSPNQQLIASLDVARRQMELEGYGLVMNAIEVALDIRREINVASGHLEVFQRRRCRWNGAARVPNQRLHRFPRAGHALGRSIAQHAGGRVLPRSDPHDPGLRNGGFRRHVVQGPACRRIQHPGQQDLAQFGAAAVEHQQHAQRRRAPDRRAAQDQQRASNSACSHGGEAERKAFDSSRHSLMKDVPDLPNFSRFHDAFRHGRRDKHPGR